MSVLIKGMKIPETCIECMNSGLKTAIKCTEWTKTNTELIENHRAISCPLVEVPKKHGRLFDETEVKRVLHDLPDGEYKWGALALLMWAVEKRWCIEAENE